MDNISLQAATASGLAQKDIQQALSLSVQGLQCGKVLLVVPDFTRFHSGAGGIANYYYHLLKDRCQVDLLVALGTHLPMPKEECRAMYGDIPFARFIMHNWRQDVVQLGQVPGSFVHKVSGGLVASPINVEVNRILLGGEYDLILSVGQVVPHEVVGMANHSKNIFVGCGGASMINGSHMLGAFYGMERMMGRDNTPVRKVFDYAAQHFLQKLPLCYVLTVTTAHKTGIAMHGLFIGKGRSCFAQAVKLAQQTNLTLLDKPLQTVLVNLDEAEFKSTWLGNKSIYRTRMAIASGGQLVVLAPGVNKFGEDETIDALIRKYGYCGRGNIIQLCEKNEDLRQNLSAAAHLIHGSSDGRFSVTYCTQHLGKAQLNGVHFGWANYQDALAKYRPETLQEGFNTLPGGEEVFYIPNPALGLWAYNKNFLSEG